MSSDNQIIDNVKKYILEVQNDRPLMNDLIRGHLAIEWCLENRFKKICPNPNILLNPKKGRAIEFSMKVKVLMAFDEKTPIEVYNWIDKLNKLRNKVAHGPQSEEFIANEIDKLYNILNNEIIKVVDDLIQVDVVNFDCSQQKLKSMLLIVGALFEADLYKLPDEINVTDLHGK